MRDATCQATEGLPANLLLHYKYMAAVRRVARGVAHSYNNIFTGLAGQTTILQQENALLGDVGGKRTELIGDLLQRGIDQTAVLSGFARDVETDLRIHSPLLIAGKALELLRCISRVHRFELVNHLHQGRIRGNFRELQLLLFYLGENCVDATPDGGPIVLELSAEGGDDEADFLCFCFRDRGPGIPADLLASLGTPFVTTRTDTPGRGLGWYAARMLADRYGGSFRLVRQEQETRVSVLLPRLIEEQHQSPLPTPLARPRRAEVSKQCFLVVEDDEAMRKLLLSRLQRRGHMVFCVDTCVEALQEYSLLYDIITIVLMDIGLRDDSGYECCRKMVAINPAARVIFMSGQEEKAPKEMASRTVFLQKPFTMDQLEEAVHDVQI